MLVKETVNDMINQKALSATEKGKVEQSNKAGRRPVGMDMGCDVNIGQPKYHSITQVTFGQVLEGHEEFSQVDTPERAFLERTQLM